MTTAFDFLKRLPDATVQGDYEKEPGLLINAAYIDGTKSNVLVNVMHGAKVPQITWTVSVAGRGSLVMGEQEFRDPRHFHRAGHDRIVGRRLPVLGSRT